MSKPKNMEAALDDVRTFLKSLVFTNQTPELFETRIFFGDVKRGEITLYGKEMEDFISCSRGLFDAVSHQELFSERAVEKLLEEAILVAWNNDETLVKLTKGQVKIAVNGLRAALLAKPQTYFVCLPVLGIHPSTLPQTVGKVEFMPGDRMTVDSIKQPAMIMDSHGSETKNMAAFRNNMSDQIDANFLDNIIARVEVRSHDSVNAEEEAIRECMRTIDALNFFSDLFGIPGGVQE